MTWHIWPHFAGESVLGSSKLCHARVLMHSKLNLALCLGCKLSILPLRLCQIWFDLGISAQPTVSYHRFSPSVSTTKPLVVFSPDEKASPEGPVIERRAFTAHYLSGTVHTGACSLPHWSLFSWQFGQLDFLLESGEQVSGNATSWCCSYSMTGAWRSQNLSEGIYVWFPY